MMSFIEYKFPQIRTISDRLIDNRYKSFYDTDMRRFSAMQNLYKGYRCFLVGSGPSLAKTDLSKLKKEICFGVNSLITDNQGIRFRYYGLSSANASILDNFIVHKEGTLFLFRRAARLYIREYPRTENIIAIRTNGLILKKRGFPVDLSNTIYGGGGTTMVTMLQIIFYMGFSEVYLIGNDCDYSGESSHITDYEKPPFEGEKEKEHWNKVFKAYEICKTEFEKEGRKIFNSTVGGNLEVFPRKSLEDLE